MRTIKIYGASDDLVEIEGHPDGDEVSTYDATVLISIASGTADAPVGEYVRMIFYPGKETGIGDGWSAQIANLAEDAPTHPIRVSIHPEETHSVLVEIDVPDDAKLSWTVEDQ